GDCWTEADSLSAPPTMNRHSGSVTGSGRYKGQVSKLATLSTFSVLLGAVKTAKLLLASWGLAGRDALRAIDRDGPIGPTKTPVRRSKDLAGRQANLTSTPTASAGCKAAGYERTIVRTERLCLHAAGLPVTMPLPPTSR